MHKQLATRRNQPKLLQVMEMMDTDQDLLAKFLDHDIRVHSDVYRLPIGILQKAISSETASCSQSGWHVVGGKTGTRAEQ